MEKPKVVEIGLEHLLTLERDSMILERLYEIGVDNWGDFTLLDIDEIDQEISLMRKEFIDENCKI